MTIKPRGGVFGRNPTFNNVEVEGALSVDGNTVPDASTILVDGDIGSTVQGYDADTALLDVAQTWTQPPTFPYVNVNTGSRGTFAKFNGNAPENGYLGGFASFNLMYNAEIASNGVWTARGTSASILTCAGGYIDIATDTGLTSGNTFTPTSRFTSDASGNFAINDGNLVIGTSGKGIDFSATAGTGTSELFSDYEEGNWTPTLENGTSITYSSQSGKYVKVGDIVHIECYLNVATSSADASNIAIGGLPYAPDVISSYAACTLSVAEFDSTFLDVATNGIPHLNFLSSGSVLVLDQTYNDCNSSGKLRLAATYRA